MRKNALFGYLTGVCAVLFWSYNVIIARYMANELTPWQISLGRWAVAGAVLMPFYARPLWRKRQILMQNFWRILILSVSGIALQNTLVYQAGHTAGAVNMALLGTTGPVFLVIFSAMLLKTKVSPKQCAGFLIALFGVLTIIMKGHLTDIENFQFVRGDFYMLIGAAVFGLYGAFQAGGVQGLSENELLAASIFAAVVFLAIVCAVTYPYAPAANLTAKGVWTIVYMGVLPSLFSYFCWNVTLETLGSLKAGLIYYLMPVFSSLEAAVVLHEGMTKVQLAGGALVLLGVFIAAYHRPKHVVTIKRA